MTHKYDTLQKRAFGSCVCGQGHDSWHSNGVFDLITQLYVSSRLGLRQLARIFFGIFAFVPIGLM